MRVFFINPNSDENLGKFIEKELEEHTSIDNDFAFSNNQSGPKFLSNSLDEAKGELGVIELVNKHKGDFDAFVITCTRDPFIDTLRLATDKPVVGCAESSFKFASILGARFSLLQTSLPSIQFKWDLIRKYKMEKLCSSIRGFDPNQQLSLEEGLVLEANKAIDIDRAEVIIFGGAAGIGRYSTSLKGKIKVPIVDGLRSAICFAESLVRMGLKTSKIGKYHFLPPKSYDS